MNIAIISPDKNVYSETFIHAHKNLLHGNVNYYYQGLIPTKLEGEGVLWGTSKTAVFWNKILYHISKAISANKLSFSSFFLRRSLKKKKIDVVLAEYGHIGSLVAPLCKSINIPLVVHFHGADATHEKFIKGYAQQYKTMFTYAHSIIVVSKVMERKLISMGAPKEKLIYNCYGPHDAFLELSPTLSQKTCIAIGRFVDKKAPYYTLLAFQKVLKKHPDAKLLLAGSGVLEDVCKNLVAYWKMEESVQFLGVITPQEFRKQLINIRAFVQHSITATTGDMEGTPVAVLEAQAAGVPVISTHHAGIPDVVIHGKTGFLVEEHDVDTMAKYMIQVLGDEVLAKHMGSEGKKRIKEAFTMQMHIDKLNKVLETAASGK